MANEINIGGIQELSTDINTITAEINAYQRVAGEAIFEIGRRLKHVKENDLVHGEFGKWLEEIGVNDRMARKFMKIADEIPKERTTSSGLGVEALYQIATLPEHEREAEHITSKGETKKPEDMTVKELRELKRQLKQAEQSAETERKERERLEKENEELSQQEPETVTKYITPSDYEELKQENESYRRRYGGNSRIVDEEERKEFYQEFANDLNAIVVKYGSIIFDGNKVREYGGTDVDYAEKVNEFDSFWKRYAKTVMNDQVIINMEEI